MPHLYRPRELRINKRPPSARTQQIFETFDDLIEDRDRVAAMTVEELQRPLYRVAFAERGVPWTERFVALYCAKRVKAARASSLRLSIINHYEAAGQGEAAAAFSAKIDRILAPDSLTHHGYGAAFRHREVATIIPELREAMDTLSAMGYDNFLNSGTLLGSIREGNLLGHDDDIDIAVVLPTADQREVSSLMYKLMAQLVSDHGFTAYMSRQSPVIKQDLASGTRVDIFPAFIDDGRFYVWPHTFGEIGPEAVLPLGEGDLIGTAFPVPRASDRMLALNYGDNWRTPDKNFIFNWSQARVNFRPMLKRHRLNVRLARVKRALGLK